MYYVVELTTVGTCCHLDPSRGLLGGEERRSGHHEPGHSGLAGQLSLLGGQEQVVLLPDLEVHLVDAGLEVGGGRGEGAELGSPHPRRGLDEQQLQPLPGPGRVGGRVLQDLLNLNQTKVLQIYKNKII